MADYRLQTLLELRQRAEDGAKEALSRALQQLAEADGERERLETELARRIREREARGEAQLAEVLAIGAVGVAALGAMDRYQERLQAEEAELAARLAVQRERVEAAQEQVEARRQELTAATIERKAIENHRETWSQQVKKEHEAREEQAQEETAQALHLARSRRNEGG